MSALFCLFLCSRSYPEKLEVYIPKFYKIRYILHELHVAVIWIISQLIICIDQLNTGIIRQIKIIFMCRLITFFVLVNMPSNAAIISSGAAQFKPKQVMFILGFIFKYVKKLSLYSGPKFSWSGILSFFLKAPSIESIMGKDSLEVT